MEQKIRSTRQRAAVLDALLASYDHPTTAQIYKIVKKQFPAIGLATVYRNLEHLEKERKIIRLKAAGKEARFDAHMARHFHLICRKCETITDIFDPEKIKIDFSAIAETGFHPEPDYLEIFGVCRQCQ